MSQVAQLIADMVRAGVDPELIGRTAELLAHDDQAERRRAADRERKRIVRVSAMSAESADAPHPPALDKENPPTPPKEINPTPLTPQATQLGGRDGGEMDRLSMRLCDAANGKMQPQSALVVGPVLEMVAQGVDLETDILPVIGAVAAKLNKSVSLKYFLPAIREAHAARIEAGRGLTKPKPSNIVAGQWEQHLPPDEQRVKWVKTLSMARPRDNWKSWLWGPPPGQPGCRVPLDLIEPRDLTRHWFEEKHPEAA